jgi:hypothetical protein
MFFILNDTLEQDTLRYLRIIHIRYIAYVKHVPFFYLLLFVLK